MLGARRSSCRAAALKGRVRSMQAGNAEVKQRSVVSSVHALLLERKQNAQPSPPSRPLTRPLTRTQAFPRTHSLAAKPSLTPTHLQPSPPSWPGPAHPPAAAAGAACAAARTPVLADPHGAVR
eukprot:1137516-Pelagomonas_calceolata.AAC.3